MNPEVRGHLVVAAGAPVGGTEWSNGRTRSGGEGGGGEGGRERSRDSFTAVHHTLRKKEKHVHCSSVSLDVKIQSDDRDAS